jgi:formate hydrogenlyase subunit 3/multisubunit Na+/H+ antiporter MnhD subunit
MQRRIADHDINAKFIGMAPRIIGGLLASFVAAVVLFACFYLVSEEGSEESLLAMNVTLAGAIIGIFTVVNFVNFIVFKPRQ